MTDQRRKLVLVRHSLPDFVTGIPANTWPLSAEGRRRCRRLAQRLAGHELVAIVTSEEPKAAETGQIAAEALGLPYETWPGLHEHERGVVRSLGSAEDFKSQVARFFERPAELVMGYETADEAHTRFAASVSRIVEQFPLGNLAVVSHGTVMTLFVSRANGLDAFSFWASLGLPAYAVLSLPRFRLLEVVREV